MDKKYYKSKHVTCRFCGKTFLCANSDYRCYCSVECKKGSLDKVWKAKCEKRKKERKVKSNPMPCEKKHVPVEKMTIINKTKLNPDKDILKRVESPDLSRMISYKSGKTTYFFASQDKFDAFLNKHLQVIA